MKTIGQYRVDRVTATRAVALAAHQNARPKGIRAISPVLRQATVVSYEPATSPPSCTIRFDTVTPGPTHPLTRFAWPYIPTPGDLVYAVVLGNGDAWVLCKMAQGDTAPQQIDAAGTVTTSSTSYVALSGGPVVPVLLSAGQIVKVTAYARLSVGPAGGPGHQAAMSWAVSGADTAAAADANAVESQSAQASPGQKTGLYVAATAGSHTFTAQYKSASGTDTATFVNRRILVEP